MVVISRPSTSAASERHDFTRLPSISTVQAPHWPRPQPFLEPVRCRCSRRASSSVVRGSSVSRCSVPLTRSTTSSGAGTASAPCAAAAGTAPGKEVSCGEVPPVAAASFSSSRRVTIDAGHGQASLSCETGWGGVVGRLIRTALSKRRAATAQLSVSVMKRRQAGAELHEFRAGSCGRASDRDAKGRDIEQADDQRLATTGRSSRARCSRTAFLDPLVFHGKDVTGSAAAD